MSRAGPPRLLLFNLATDADDAALGFTTGWIRELARHAQYVDVVSMRVGRVEVPENVSVHSVGKERGWSEPRRAIEFYRILRRLLGTREYDACFAHMMPLFAVMGWPLLKARGIPITLWYAHPSVTASLRLAEKVVSGIVTGAPKSFPLPSRKVIVVGQGIDTDLFQPGPIRPAGDRFTVTYVGRIAPRKRLEMLLDAVRILSREGIAGDLDVRLIGPIYGSEAHSYEAALRKRVEEIGLAETVTLLGVVPLDRLIREYREADVVANMSELGFFDKTVLEAWSCGVPAFTTNRAFEPSLAVAPFLLVREENPEGVAETIRRVSGMSAEERAELGGRLREVVIREHSLKRLAELLWRDVLVRNRG